MGSEVETTNEQQLALLLEITNQVVSILNFQDLLKEISSTIRRVLPCHAVAVILPEADGKNLRLHGFATTEGLPGPPDIPFPADASPAGEVLRTGETLVLNPIPRERIPFGSHIPDVIGLLVELPLKSRNRNLGVLVVGVPTERTLDENDLSFLGQVAKPIAMALENSLAYREAAELKSKLEREKTYLADAQRLTRTGSWAWDPASGAYDYWSEEMFRIYGFDPKEGPPTRKTVLQRIHPEDVNRVEANFQKSYCEKTETIDEYRIEFPDGTVKHIHMIRHPILNGAGDLVKLLGTSMDVTERKRAEEVLRRSQAYLADAQKLTHTGAWACDSTTQPLYWSDEVFRIFGFDPQDGLPTLDQPLERIHPEDREIFWEGFQRAIQKKVDVEVEYRILTPDGRVKHIRALAHPVLDENGALIEEVGTIVDITALKQAEEERERLRRVEADLRHLNRVSMMGELAASIAHEVNQPLSGIVSNGSACVRWLGGEVPNVEEARETARRIVRDGKRAAEIIARIRALATKKVAVRKEELNLNDTIREVLSIIGSEAKKKSVIVRTQFADDLSAVSGDRVHLQQVALNLVLNAIEAMGGIDEAARELVITTRNVDIEQVEVMVEDTGPGLDQDAMARIFEPFYTTKPSGMGMGLAISRSILEAHGGRLWATAKDGPGTVFHFSLPKFHESEANAAVAGT
jgi:PAS domain S-box-containing protein